MMMVTIGLYHHRTKVARALRILGLCFLGNFIGGLVLALLLRVSSITSGEPTALMDDAVAHKLAYIADGASGWGDLLARAILCNFMINLAMLLVYNGVIKDDLTKSIVMVVSVFVFAYVGLEHSVANTVIFTVAALQGGVDLGLAAGEHRPRPARQLHRRRTAHRLVLRLRQRRQPLLPAGLRRCRSALGADWPHSCA